MAPRKQATMTDAHKRALAAGREQSRIVREYLEVLEEVKPRRGRRRTPESIRKRLDVVEQQLADAPVIQRLQLLQERRDLEAELEEFEEPIDVAAYEKDFTRVAKAYSNAKGISYSTWREMGVPADVLRKAGIERRMS